MMPPYTANSGQACAVATLWEDARIIGQVQLVLQKPRVRWLPWWFPFNLAETTDREALGLFSLVKTRWERDGYSGYVPKWLRAGAI